MKVEACIKSAEKSTNFFFNFGGPYRIRTGDLLIANEALYQLS